MILATTLVSALLPGTTRGGSWWCGFDSPPNGEGFDEDLCCGRFVEYDGKLVATGSFTDAGGTPASRVAAWNGVAWEALGEGIGPGEANASIVYDGSLIVGGEFREANGAVGDGLARWNGSSWEAFAGGIGTAADSYVLCMTEFNGDLIVGGLFTQVGGSVSAHCMARWDGTQWHAMGSGPSGGYVGDVIALAVHNGKLIAAGDFGWMNGLEVNGIASWNGTTWSSLGSGVAGSDAIVWALTVYGSHLVAGGSFEYAGGQYANLIARWNGSSWSAVGDGMGGYGVLALGTYNGDLIAGGYLDTAGYNPVNDIARWDGVSWSPLGSGTSSSPFMMASFGGSLFVGGHFTMAGDAPSYRVARWDDAPVAAVGDLTCSVEGQTVSMTWTNDEPYDAVRVVRDRELLVLLPGTTSTCDDLDVAVGSHTYQVAGLINGIDGCPARCTVEVTPVVTPGEAIAVDGVFQVGPIRPNPFRRRALIPFTIPEQGHVAALIFDPAGRRVRVLADGLRGAGRHLVEWDGRWESGRPADRGVYFARVEAGSRSATRRLMLVR